MPTAKFIETSQAKRGNFYVTNSSFKKNKIPNNEKSTYKSLSPKYNYGTDDKKDLASPNFQLLPCITRIRKDVDETNGKVTWKMVIVIKDEAELKGLREIDLGLLDCCYKMRDELELDSRFTVEMPGKEYRNVCFKAEKDKDGNKIIDPVDMVILKMDERSVFEYVESIVNGKVTTISWKFEDLVGENIYCTVVFNIRYLYGGKNIAPQIYVNSCIIHDTIEDNNIVDQTTSSSIQDYYAKNPSNGSLQDKLNQLRESVATKTKEGSLLTTSTQNISTQPNMPRTLTQSIDPNQYVAPPYPQADFSHFMPQNQPQNMHPGMMPPYTQYNPQMNPQMNRGGKYN